MNTLTKPSKKSRKNQTDQKKKAKRVVNTQEAEDSEPTKEVDDVKLHPVLTKRKAAVKDAAKFSKKAKLEKKDLSKDSESANDDDIQQERQDSEEKEYEEEMEDCNNENEDGDDVEEESDDGEGSETEEEENSEGEESFTGAGRFVGAERFAGDGSFAELDGDSDSGDEAFICPTIYKKPYVPKRGTVRTFGSDAVHFYVGNLPSRLSVDLKEQLKCLLVESGVEVLDVRGRIGKRFCHCTVKADSKEKIEELNGKLEFNDSILKFDLSVGGLLDRKQEKEIDEKSFERIDFFIGLQESFTVKLWKELLAFFPEKGIKLLEIRGFGGKKFCHCTLANPEDKEKMEALNGTQFHGEPLTIDIDQTNVGQPVHNAKPQLRAKTKRVGLREVDPNIVTVHLLKQSTGAFHAYINKKTYKAYIYFNSVSKANKLLADKTVTVAGCTMDIEQGGYRSKPDLNCNSGNCVNCDEPGHLAKSCPKPIRCRHCKKFEGHLSKDCPERKPEFFRKSWICNNCEEAGHIAKDCPKPIRCHNCKKFDGHQSKDCPEKFAEFYRRLETGEDPSTSQQGAKKWIMDTQLDSRGFVQYPGSQGNSSGKNKVGGYVRDGRIGSGSCVNCDETGHIAKQCPKPIRCRVCKQFAGHIAKNCPQRSK